MIQDDASNLASRLPSLRPKTGVGDRQMTSRTTLMNMSELDLSTWFALAAALLGISAWIGVLAVNRRLRAEQARTDQLQKELELVRQSISGLTAGAVGMDRRMQRLETREKLLSERQETYEIQQSDEQPYGHAIRLVQQGAAVSRLVDELELSESEAELIVRLHGQRNSA